MSKLYQQLATKMQAYDNCVEAGNTEWQQCHGEAIEALAKNHLPSGSGFDCGTEVDFDRSTGEQLVLFTSFHHMNENGMYDGWTEHTVTVRPSLQFGFRLSISGRNRNDIKEYIHEVFSAALNSEETE